LYGLESCFQIGFIIKAFFLLSTNICFISHYFYIFQTITSTVDSKPILTAPLGALVVLCLQPLNANCMYRYTCLSISIRKWLLINFSAPGAAVNVHCADILNGFSQRNAAAVG